MKRELILHTTDPQSPLVVLRTSLQVASVRVPSPLVSVEQTASPTSHMETHLLLAQTEDTTKNILKITIHNSDA